MSNKPEWETAPKNLEDMAFAIQQLHRWQIDNNKKVPAEWCLIPTHELFENLIMRIVFLETQMAWKKDKK